MRIRLLIGISIFVLVAIGCGAAPAAEPVPTAGVPTVGRTAPPPSTAIATPSVAAAPATSSPTPPMATATPPRPTATTPPPPPTLPVNPGTPRAIVSAAASARITTASARQVTVKLEVADTPASRAVGLSKRSSLPEDAGMIFVFPSDDQAPFWMKDTWIPLSIAFISSQGRIVDIQDMQPMSEDLHRPARPYRYALEVNQGFFKKNGVNTGDSVELQLGGRQ